MRSRWFLTFAAVALLSAGALVTSTSPAGATTVTDEATFRAAWTNAAETQITLAADITLTNCGAGVPTRSSATALTLTGNGHTIRQTCASQGVLSRSGTGLTTLDGVTITGGDSAGFGGGILSSGGPLTLNGSTITANHAATSGGGITEVGTLTLTNSTVSNNTAGAAGGGTLVQGPAVVTNSTISGNTSTTGGGGIHANPGPLTITNSTITGNTDLGGGGGVVADNGTITLVYTTIAQNTSGTGANVMASTSLVSFGSVVALPTGGGTNCGFLGAPSTTSNGNNFSDDASCGFTAATDRQNAGDPGLSALANNGGPTQTRLPQPGSPLIDAIPVASCQADGASGITTDQRGVTRPQGAGCDIGAVEVQQAAAPPAPPPLVITPKFTG